MTAPNIHAQLNDLESYLPADKFRQLHTIISTVQAENDQLKAHLQAIPMGLIQIDDREEIKEINEQAAHILQQSRTSARNQPLTSILPPAIARAWQHQRLTIGDRPTAIYTGEVTGENQAQQITITAQKIPPATEIQLLIQTHPTIDPSQSNVPGTTAFYEFILNNQPDFVIRFQPTGAILFANHTFYQYMDSTVEASSGANFFLYLSDPLQEKFHKEIQQVTADHPTFTVEGKVRDIEGNTRWHRWINRALFNDTGEMIEILANGRDITAKKETETALRHSQAGINALLNNKLITFTLIDPNHKIIAFNEITNDAAKKLFGKPMEIGRNIKEYTRPEHRMTFEHRFNQALQGEASNIERDFALPDGKTLWFSTHYVPVKNEAGAVLGVCMSALNITDQKEQQMTLAQSEKNYRNLFTGSHDAILIFTPEEEVILNANPRAGELYGYSHEEMIGMSMSQLTLKPQLGRQKLAELQQGKEPVFFETTQRTSDGSTIWVEINSSLIQYNNQAAILSINRDITHRKEIVEKLRASEERFFLAFNESPVGKMIGPAFDQPARVNQTFADMVGYSRKRLEALPAHEIARLITHPDYQEAHETEFTKVITNPEQYSFRLEKQYQRKNGDTFWGELTVSVLKNDDGTPRLILAVITDIDQRKKTELALQESEERLSSFFNSAPLLMGIVQLEGDDIRQIIDNKKVTDSLGLPPGSTANRLVCEFGIPRPLHDQWLNHHRQALAENRSVSFEYQLALKDKTSWYQTVVNPISIPDKRLSYVAIDITEQKRHLEQLYESEEKFRQLAENIEHVFWLRTPQKILYVSTDFEQLTGRPYQPLYTEGIDYFLKTIHPDDRAMVQKKLAAENERLENFDINYRILKPDGTIRWVRARSFGFFVDAGDQKEYRLVGMAEDITIQRESEQELRRAKRAAEAANQAKSTFLATMSHEMRTPLNVISGFIQELESDPHLKKQHGTTIASIHQHANQLLAIINDVLNMAKLEAGRLDLERTEVNVREFLAAVLQTAEQLCTAGKLDFRFQQQTAVPAKIIADKYYLQQILTNLLSNAVKFTDQGQVTFRLGHFEQTMRFEVQDTGSGIAPADLETIFTPFVQVGDRLKKKKGTGLGLSLSQKLAQKMKSQIQVDSTIDNGSRFWFDLPLEGDALAPTEIIEVGEIDVIRSTPPSLPKQVPLPPRETLAQLQRLAEGGLLSELRFLVNELAGKNPEYRQFIETIDNLLTHLKIDEIWEYMTQLLEESPYESN